MLMAPFLIHGTDTSSLVLEIVVIASLAAAIYCGTTLLLWILMRRPPGPERELQQLIARMRARFGPA